MAFPFRSKAAPGRPTPEMSEAKKNAPMHTSEDDAQEAMKASVANGLSVIKSFQEVHFASNESSATDTLRSLIECMKCCIKTKNCDGVLDIIQFLHKANRNDAWIVATSEEVLPKLPAIITGDLASGNHLLQEESTKIISHLFELGVDFIDVDDDNTVNHLSNLGTLACFSLFNCRPPTDADGISIEKGYILDCLFRRACGLLCNIVAAFPQTIEGLYSSLNNRTFELVRLSCHAPESSIRRSLVMLISILAAKYDDLRSAMYQYLSESFNQSEVLSDLFRSIDPSQEEGFRPSVEEFRETVSNMQNDNDCFVTKACTVVVSSNETIKSNHCYDLCNIDWDKNSFALNVEGMDPIRIPWYAVCVARCDYQNKSIIVETKQASEMKSIRIEFKLCTEHAMRRITHRLRSRITTGKSMDMGVPVQRKVSESLPHTETGHSKISADVGTIFSKLSRDGTLLQKNPNDHEGEIEIAQVENKGKAASVSFNPALLETADSNLDTPSVSTSNVPGHISRQPTKTIDIEEDVEPTRGLAGLREIEKSIAGASVPPTHTHAIRVFNLTQSRIDDAAWDENTRQDPEELVPLTSKCTGSEKGFQKLYSRSSIPAIDPKFLVSPSPRGDTVSRSSNELGISLPAYLNTANKKGIDDTDDDMGGRKTGASNRRGGKKKSGTLKSPTQLFRFCIPEREGESSLGIEGNCNRELDVLSGSARYGILEDDVGNQREASIGEEEDGELFSKLIAMVNSTVRMRNRQTRLLIEKSRARMEKSRDEATKAKKKIQKELKDVLQAEYRDERTKYAKYGHELKASVRQRLKAVGGVAKKVATRRKEGVKLSRAVVEAGARTKMTGHLTELRTKLRSQYEKNVLVRRRSAQKASSLMRGISSLMMANTEE